MASPRLRLALAEKAAKVARAPLASLRASYEAERVNEICRYRRAELARAIPEIVWLRA